MIRKMNGLLLLVLIMSSCSKKIDELKVAVLLEENITDYQTSNVNSATKYTFLEHLYSPIIEHNEKGLLESQFVENIEWYNKTLMLKIKKDIKYSDGSNLNCDVIHDSFQNALKMGALVHSDIGLFLLDGEKSIRCKDGFLTFELNKKTDLFLSTLTTIDLAIVPSSKIDKKGLIKDYSVTTGPYYVKAFAKNEVTLLKNQHYQTNREYPEKLILINSESSEHTISMLLNNKVDFTTTDDFLNDNERHKILEQNTKLKVHKTLPVKLRLLSLTKVGREKFSKEELNFLSIKFQDAFEFGIKAHQFFPELAFGSIDKNKLEKVYKLKREKQKEPSVKIKIAMHPAIEKKYNRELSKLLDFIEIVDIRTIYDFKNEIVDGYLMSVDTGYQENISMISYIFKTGFFGDISNSTQYRDKFIDMEKTEKRVKFVEQLHENALASSYFVPLYISPYSLVGKEDFTSPVEKTFSNTRFWTLEKK